MVHIFAVKESLIGICFFAPRVLSAGRVNTWLLTARSDGTVDELYRYWMLGHVRETQPPRWSVIHDVLGWTD